MLGSQSSKLKKATLGISGDPRFRLTSTVSHQPWVFLTAIVGAVLAAGVVMWISDGALAKQENISASYDCLGQLRGALDPHKHVIDEARAAVAAKCLDTLAPLEEAEAAALFSKVQASFAEARRVHQTGVEAAEVKAVHEFQDRVEDFYRWYVQNKTRFGL